MQRLIYLFVTILLLLSVSSCTNRRGAEKALEAHGFKRPYTIGGYGWMSCSEDDFYATKFRAYSPDSTKIVSGCVCQGLFKGKTVRLD